MPLVAANSSTTLLYFSINGFRLGIGSGCKGNFGQIGNLATGSNAVNHFLHIILKSTCVTGISRYQAQAAWNQE